MVSVSNHEVRAHQAAGQPSGLRLMKATDGGAEPVDSSCAGSRERASRLELGSAVGTGVLGVHRECPGRFADCPTAADPWSDQATLFALPQSGP